MKGRETLVAIAAALYACGEASSRDNADAVDPVGAANGTAATAGEGIGGSGGLGSASGGGSSGGFSTGTGGSAGGCPSLAMDASASAGGYGSTAASGLTYGGAADAGAAVSESEPDTEVGLLATFAVPTEPLLLDVTLDYSPPWGVSSRAAVSATRGFLTLENASYATQLVTITAPDQIAIEPVPPLLGSVVADPTGEPLLLGLQVPGYAPTAFRREATGWHPETLPTVLQPQAPRGARFGADGRAHVVLNDRLMTRSTGGVWSETVLPPLATPLSSALAIDSLQEPHVVYYSLYDSERLFDWQPNQPPLPLTDRRESPRQLQAAAISSGRIAVAAQEREGIRLLLPTGAEEMHWQLLPDTQYNAPTGCPWPSTCSPVPPTPCTERADTVNSFALSATSNGDLWLAYLSEHIDRDRILSCTAGGNCQLERVQDRSTAEIILMRVPLDGTPAQASDIRWRASAPAEAWLTSDARGSELTIVSTWSHESQRGFTRYVVLDTTKL